MATFKGISTVDKDHAPYTLTDRELIKRDLLNTFYTRKGERVMRPNYGSIIWDLLMDPQDTLSEHDIRADVERIINADPRVTLIDAVVIAAEHTIRIDVTINFVQYQSSDILYLEYVREATSAEGINQ